LSGIVQELTGNVDRPVAFTHLRAPRDVRLVGVKLRWGSAEDWAQSKTIPPGYALLTEFLKLSDASDAAIENYAQTWGVLDICEHGVPATHNARRTAVDPPGSACGPRRDGESFWEKIADWRQFSREARAILNIAADLHLGKRATGDDWLVVGCGARPNADAERVVLSFSVNRWLGLANVRLLFTWESEPVVHIGGPGLFGMLALQLASAIARNGLVLCSGCSGRYEATRKPQSGRRSYCPECRKRGVPTRDAQRARQKRRRV